MSLICHNCGNSAEYTLWCCERKNWCCKNCNKEKCSECCEKHTKTTTNSKIRTITICLDKDYNENEAKLIISSINMIRGVDYITVQEVNGADIIAREVAKLELKKEIQIAIDKILDVK